MFPRWSPGRPGATLRRMKTRAAVAYEAGKPLVIEEVELDGPKAGEVLVEIKATGVCHTDEFTRSGADPEGLFPVIFGHEGRRHRGRGRRRRDRRCRRATTSSRSTRRSAGSCKSCLSRKTNLCTAIRATQGKGLMPDGTSRFSIGGQKIHHYMGCSTFAQHTVLPEIALAKIRPDAPFDKVCYIGCGVTTGLGAVLLDGEGDARARTWWSSAWAASASTSCRARASRAPTRSSASTLNPAREPLARKFGLTHFVNPRQVSGRSRRAPRRADRRRRRLQLRVRRQRRSDAPGAGVLPPRLGRVDHHRRRRRRTGDQDPPVPAGHRAGLARDRVRRRARPHRRAPDRRLVHERQDRHRQPDHPQAAARADQRSLRPDARREVDPHRRRVLDDRRRSRRSREQRCFGGVQGFYRHASAATGGPMRFGVFVPAEAGSAPRPGPLLPGRPRPAPRRPSPSRPAPSASPRELGLVLVTCDTSPRAARYPGDDASWDFGQGAGFYVDATEAPWRQPTAWRRT